MSLLDEIRSDLTNQSADLSNTLRKAKILASAIGLPEFTEWVDSELSGYKDRDKLPSYRVCPSVNLGYFSGPFQSGAKNVILPTVNLPERIKEYAENLRFFDGVGALEAQAKKSSQVRWPSEMVMLARESLKMTDGSLLIDAHKPVPGHIVPGIMDQVKNKLLDFILALDEYNVTAEDLSTRKVNTDVARNIFNTYIYGNQNTVATGEQVTQQVTTVEQGNVESLLNYLRTLNVDDADLNELQHAIATEPAASEGSYGPKVKTWLGGMVAKATAGMWRISLETVTKGLTDALNGYYGL